VELVPGFLGAGGIFDLQPDRAFSSRVLGGDFKIGVHPSNIAKGLVVIDRVPRALHDRPAVDMDGRFLPVRLLVEASPQANAAIGRVDLDLKLARSGERHAVIFDRRRLEEHVVELAVVPKLAGEILSGSDDPIRMGRFGIAFSNVDFVGKDDAPVSRP